MRDYEEACRVTELGKIWLVAGLLLSGLLVYLLAPVLTPFLSAALLAYLGDPLVDKLEARRLPRTAAVVLVFAGIILLVTTLPFVLIPLLEHQLQTLVQALPAYIARIQTEFLPWLSSTLNLPNEKLNGDLFKALLGEHWQQMGGVAGSLLRAMSISGLALLGWLANLLLIPVATFYLLRDWDILVARIGELLPRRQFPIVARLARESDKVLGAFLRGQLLVMACLGAVYSIGLWLVGLDLSLLIGLLAGLVSFVPYLGFIVGIVIAGIAAVMQFHDLVYLLPVVAVFGVGQALEGMLLTPMLVGDKIGLHPVAVIFAVMAGGQLFGFVGILLALPMAAVIMVLLRFAHERYRGSKLYADEVRKAENAEADNNETVQMLEQYANSEEAKKGVGQDEPG